MPESIIRIGADVSEVSVKFKKVGDEGKKAFDWTGKLGQTLSEVPKKLVTVAGALALVGAAAREAMRVADDNARLARGANGTALRTGAASLRGPNAAATAAFVESNASSLTTREGRLSLAEGMGQLMDERRAKGLPNLGIKDIQQLQGLYQAGGDQVFGKGGADIVSALRENPFYAKTILGRQLAGRLGIAYNGQDLNRLTAQNLAQLPPEARTALQIGALGETADRAEYERGIKQQHDLANAEERRRFETDHPVAGAVGRIIKDTVGKIPGVTPVVESGERVGEGKQANDHLKDINDNIDKMANRTGNPVLPNLNTRQEPRP